MKALLLKLDTAVYTVWKAAAVRDGLNVSEWIRYQCNNAANALENYKARLDEKLQPESEKVNGSADNQNVRRLEASPVSRQRSVARKNRAPRGGVDRDGGISANAYDTAASNRGTERADVASVVGERSVTRENFAEVLATIPKDEIDRWARSLPPEVLPSHSGDRHICVCKHCLEYRRLNAIPYGGPVKKEKAKR